MVSHWVDDKSLPEQWPPSSLIYITQPEWLKLNDVAYKLLRGVEYESDCEITMAQYFAMYRGFVVHIFEKIICIILGLHWSTERSHDLALISGGVLDLLLDKL